MTTLPHRSVPTPGGGAGLSLAAVRRGRRIAVAVAPPAAAQARLSCPGCGSLSDVGLASRLNDFSNGPATGLPDRSTWSGERGHDHRRVPRCRFIQGNAVSETICGGGGADTRQGGSGTDTISRRRARHALR